MKQFLFWLIGVGGVLAVLYFFPWKMTWSQERVVTVVGEASSQENNQVARFNAGVTAVNDSKEAAVAEVNQKINAVIESVRAFGVKETDIKTQNMNIYQNQESYYEGDRQKQRLGQWNVSNTIEIRLRQVEKANELVDLLSRSGANNVWGPDFSLDETAQAEEALMEKAIANAKDKAEKLAAASGAKLGKVVQVVEGETGNVVGPLYRMEAGGGGDAAMAPGSTKVTKMVTVTFELR